MQEVIRELWGRGRQLVLYGVIGCLSSGLDFVVYAALSQGLRYWVANCISVTVGISVSFTLNRQYNFRVKDHTAQRFATFATVGLCGLAVSNLILWLCIDRMAMGNVPSKLLSIVLVVAGQFVVNKYVTFKTRG